LLYSSVDLVSLEDGKFENIMNTVSNGRGVEKSNNNLSAIVWSLTFLNQKSNPNIIPPIIQKIGKMKTYPREALWSF
jgi:hypothetical protein